MPKNDHQDAHVEDALEHLHDAERDRAKARALRAEADALEAKADGEDLEVEHELAEVRGCDHDDDAGTVTIVVNGREKDVDRGSIGYDKVVVLAFGDAALAVTHTVNWRRRDGEEGSLLRGGSVRVHEGMIFTATATNRS